MYSRNINEQMVLCLFYKLLQCLHHLNLMRAQVDGKVTKAFALKLTHLNDFIKPAYSGPKIRFHIDQINNSWVRNITNILVSHYSFSVSELLENISKLGLDSSQTRLIICKSVQRATKRFGNKLSKSTIIEFKKILIGTSFYNIPQQLSSTTNTHKIIIPRKQQNSTGKTNKQTNKQTTIQKY